MELNKCLIYIENSPYNIKPDGAGKQNIINISMLIKAIWAKIWLALPIFSGIEHIVKSIVRELYKIEYRNIV